MPKIDPAKALVVLLRQDPVEWAMRVLFWGFIALLGFAAGIFAASAPPVP